MLTSAFSYLVIAAATWAVLMCIAYVVNQTRRDVRGILKALRDFDEQTRNDEARARGYRRTVLPMSSGEDKKIKPGESAQITARPQFMAFRPERFLIGGDASKWLVNDIKVGNRSQFAQSGDVPGEAFAPNVRDAFLRFDAAPTGTDIVVIVTNVSDAEIPFYASMIGEQDLAVGAAASTSN